MPPKKTGFTGLLTKFKEMAWLPGSIEGRESGLILVLLKICGNRGRLPFLQFGGHGRKFSGRPVICILS